MNLFLEIRMGLSDQAKKDILSLVFRIIRRISDKEYQLRVWIRGQGPECDDFDETCCLFFGEGDSVIKKHKEFGINEFQFILLKSFRDEFKRFSDENDFPNEFIDTPEWNRITEMAKEVLKAFNTL